MRGKPRLLVVSLDGSAVGGVTRVALGVASELRSSGWETRAVFVDGIDRRALGDWAEALDVRWDVLEGRGRLAHSLSLARLIRRWKPAVVNLQHGGSHLPLKDIAVSRVLGARVVVSVHLPIPWTAGGTARRVSSRLGGRLAAAIVPCANAVRDVVVEGGVPPVKVVVIPGGVEPPRSMDPRSMVRARLGIDDERLLVSTVARAAPEKRITDLIEAVAACGSGPDAPGVIIKHDGGAEAAHIRETAIRLLPDRSWIFGGSDATVNDVYAASDIFCLASEQEGYPLVLQEAAFHGLPVVATRVGGVADLVGEDTTGLLVETGDIPQLTLALRSLAGDAELRHRLGAAGFQRAHAEFAVGVMGARYADVLRPFGDWPTVT